MDILPIQASAVPCERVFSSSKETITARRNSLSPQLVEALQLLKFAAKQGRSLSFTEGLDKDVELAELEQREKGQSVEEISIFLCDLQL
jgi:hAT family protein